MTYLTVKKKRGGEEIVNNVIIFIHGCVNAPIIFIEIFQSKPTNLKLNVGSGSLPGQDRF